MALQRARRVQKLHKKKKKFIKYSKEIITRLGHRKQNVVFIKKRFRALIKQKMEEKKIYFYSTVDDDG